MTFDESFSPTSPVGPNDLSGAFRIRVSADAGQSPEAGSQTSNKGFRFADLFAGLGGFHVALQELGGQAVFAAEWDEALNSLYEKNFGVKPWGDLGLLRDAARDVPDHDVLTAGFPCQPFSKAGEQLGFEHTLQGQLFFKVRDILEAKRPDRFILENVPNILRHKGGETLKEIVEQLESLGYSVQYGQFSPHQFGVPQIRSRAYFVGSLDGLDDYVWPNPTNAPTDIRNVLDLNPRPHRQVPEQTLRALDVWDDFLRSAPASLKLPSFPIWSMEFGATYPFEEATPAAFLSELGTSGLREYRGSFGIELDAETAQEQFKLLPSHARRPEFKFPKWKVAFIRQNRQFYEDNRSWIQPWMERSQLHEFPSSLQKFEWNAQGEARRIDQFVIQMRASGVRVKRTSTAPSLISMTHTQVPILGWERRYMTPEECARLQSLQGIQLPEGDLKAYKALGNAVNADVVREIARPLVSTLRPREGNDRRWS